MNTDQHGYGNRLGVAGLAEAGAVAIEVERVALNALARKPLNPTR